MEEIKKQNVSRKSSELSELSESSRKSSESGDGKQRKTKIIMKMTAKQNPKTEPHKNINKSKKKNLTKKERESTMEKEQRQEAENMEIDSVYQAQAQAQEIDEKMTPQDLINRGVELEQQYDKASGILTFKKKTATDEVKNANKIMSAADSSEDAKTEAKKVLMAHAKKLAEEKAKALEKNLEEMPSKDLETTLKDSGKLVSVFSRAEVPLPTTKEPKIKHLPSSYNEFVTGSGEGGRKGVDLKKVRLLMNQMTHDEMIDLFGEKHFKVYKNLKEQYEKKVQDLVTKGHDIKPSAAKFKKMVFDLHSIILTVSAKPALMKTLFKRYQSKTQAQNEKTQENKAQIMERRAANKLLAVPKRKFVGALLSKITPAQYNEAMTDFTDPEKGKNLHKYANVTPNKIIKELERRAYGESNAAVTKILTEPETFKADSIGLGIKNRIRDIESKLNKLGIPKANWPDDEEYKTYVLPYKSHSSEESVLVGDLKALLLEGGENEELKSEIKKSVQAFNTAAVKARQEKIKKANEDYNKRVVDLKKVKVKVPAPQGDNEA